MSFLSLCKTVMQASQCSLLYLLRVLHCSFRSKCHFQAELISPTNILRIYCVAYFHKETNELATQEKVTSVFALSTKKKKTYLLQWPSYCQWTDEDYLRCKQLCQLSMLQKPKLFQHGDIQRDNGNLAKPRCQREKGLSVLAMSYGQNCVKLCKVAKGSITEMSQCHFYCLSLVSVSQKTCRHVKIQNQEIQPIALWKIMRSNAKNKSTVARLVCVRIVIELEKM